MENAKRGHSFKYIAIRRWILDNIENHVFKYGDKLPSENLLCHKFEISRQTVRNAMDQLADEGIVRRVRGSGTYVAQKLGETRNKTIGVCLSFINEYIFPAILLGIEETLTAKGFGMELGITYNKIEQERRFLERMLKANVSGLIIEGTKTGLPNPNLSIYREFLRREIPVMFIHNYYPELPCASVVMDDVNCAKKLTKMLIDAGHRDIAGFFKIDDMQGQKRYEGYIGALIEAGIPVRDELIRCFTSNSQDALFEYSHHPLLADVRKCSAIVCYNDQMASKMYSYFKERGIKVPQDVSMVGFDDSFVDPAAILRLTTVRHPKRELGKAAADRLMHMVENGTESIPQEPLIVNANIICRSSIKILNKPSGEMVI
ncbi:GntR family transcriptional regulator [Christensenella tenuis]|uniref:GntR family transcriptional regulator n=1 Tax=Christensenella tenuis TaxID=2763033 RepID=A0ABR7EFV9_9FIRM|nr:GntR family transcriptional regulator [Christensenella tenuis]MBC5647934.1 GntR family transcriptional regulator [Christensenella tenuis]